ncbi:MAG: SusD/RagB family nutrient-binding outer membrane lipoprotein [Chitinophagaceae bacterium]|nr:SusD/RagB family nutrient-binding outer membrane lipoprotein [Chitinophagaceae bacterium]
MTTIYNNIKKCAGICLITAVTAVSCTKNFGDINTNPSTVTTPDIGGLFAYSMVNLESYQGTEWVWENFEQLLRYSQLMTTDPYELSTNINSRYTTFYTGILPGLSDIRTQISLKADSARYENIKAVTYIAGILQALKVTDMNGAIPYTQAAKGRADGVMTPVYDDQKTLFDTWIAELNAAISTLEAGKANQVGFGSADIYYNSDWNKWINLANTLKLRIAVRYEVQDANATKNIFKEVMQDAIGPIDSDDAQFVYTEPDYGGQPAGGIDYRSSRFATFSIIKFLKKTADPRLVIYFNPNDLTGSFKDTLTKYGKTLPSFINVNDPLVQYQGGPADWTTDPATATYFKATFDVSGSNKYHLISNINKKFFAPRFGGATSGDALDYMVTQAETCFYIAELIIKGYGDGIDTKGDAEYWYNKGITSSIQTMNKIAATAVSTTAFSGTGDAEIAAYLNNPLIKLDGTNDKERIYIQEYLNFYRLGTEAYVFCRRTGYPKNSSTYYARDEWNETIPRRYWLDEPAQGTNNTNWSTAMTAQGFTPNAKDVETLSKERIWYDKNAPAFGEGQ